MNSTIQSRRRQSVRVLRLASTYSFFAIARNSQTYFSMQCRLVVFFALGKLSEIPGTPHNAVHFRASRANPPRRRFDSRSFIRRQLRHSFTSPRDPFCLFFIGPFAAAETRPKSKRYRIHSRLTGHLHSSISNVVCSTAEAIRCVRVQLISLRGRI